MAERKQSTQRLLDQIRQQPEYTREETRLGRLVRMLDEQLCSGDPLPADWIDDPRERRREVTVRIQDNYL